MSRYSRGVGKLLGFQYYNKIVTADNFKDIEELMGAGYIEVFTDPLMLCMDCFVLGFINGKRAERQSRKTRKGA